MFKRKTLIQLAAIAASSVAISASHAQWQGIATQNAAFDAQFNARLGAMQQQNARYQQAIWQNHLKVNGPRLRSQYAQMRAAGRANFTFEQFAYWDLMTAAGTNIQGAQQHQQNQFAASQRANATVQRATRATTRRWHKTAHDNRRPSPTTRIKRSAASRRTRTHRVVRRCCRTTCHKAKRINTVATPTRRTLKARTTNSRAIRGCGTVAGGPLSLWLSAHYQCAPTDISTLRCLFS